MLVLSRKAGQQIIINGNIVITFIEMRGENARLGIEAPKEIPVHRREVAEAIQREEK